ncbi:hydrogenase maturation nickel metallochaperone HypA [Veillonella criceti]|uniref:Hydrogenase maturation factor HypA n=1 Tax=Veillonella criceti TaxID=103891 RepID=A0A380NN56_9FIRM|nr:hydrogenase maturation nickel metallochaperone HypA [Veillonella criceti]SUP44491.1 Probable hydrogenase nickel incorporation protein hypA [Veillonella criceti]
MHEMSIAEGIVDIALQTLAANQGTVVHAIQLRLGVMSGVEPDALQFCFTAVTRNTAAAGASLQIEMIPLRGKCLDCDYEFSVADYVFKCPQCGSLAIQTITGRELQVASIDMD